MVNTTKKVIKELNLRRTLFLFSNLFIPLSRLREGLGGVVFGKRAPLNTPFLRLVVLLGFSFYNPINHFNFPLENRPRL
ncbi:hypothetical protein CbuK_1923 [Coxiella burnetii CbuK_Q154]|nr:hypothetical protein CbuG_1885 [Coxiella burnetii CbuG_Q212]ACJ21033.1 hypothetical protein CbuK_1923 [Coxiella burnetii CbuK_Q154]KJY14627.1 hypothetical protein VO67_00830 [Coxiella burnetii]